MGREDEHGTAARGGARPPSAAWTTWLARSMWYATSTRPRAGGTPDAAAAQGFDPNLRVSDAERSDVAEALSKHYGDGRLDAGELEERLERAMTAKTGRDLLPLLADLPPLATPPPPVPRPSLAERLRRDVLTPVTIVTCLVAVGATGLFMMVAEQQFAIIGFLMLMAATLAGRRWRRARAWQLWHDHLHVHNVPHWHGPRGPVVYEGWQHGGWQPGRPQSGGPQRWGGNPPYSR